MTEHEIIKALEYCGRTDLYVICNSDCPMYEYCESNEEDDMNICGLALCLINRQRAEIERLNSKLAAKDSVNYYNMAQLRIARDDIKTVKSEAIKEFAERLKKGSHISYDPHTNQVLGAIVYYGEIDKLVKEMTESEGK